MKNFTKEQVNLDLEETLLVHARSYPTVARWWADFKIGRTSTNDPRPGRPNRAVTKQGIEKIEKITLRDRRVTVHFRGE